MVNPRSSQDGAPEPVEQPRPRSSRKNHRPAAPDTLPEYLPRALLVREGPAQLPERARPRNLAAATLAVAAVLLALVLAAATVGAAGIERADRASQLAEQDLYERLNVSAIVLRHDFRSERRDEMTRLFGEVGRDPDLERKRRSAARLVTLLDEEARAREERPLVSEAALFQDLDQSVRALRKMEQELEIRQGELEAARSSWPGRLAALLGA